MEYVGKIKIDENAVPNTEGFTVIKNTDGVEGAWVYEEIQNSEVAKLFVKLWNDYKEAGN